MVSLIELWGGFLRDGLLSVEHEHSGIAQHVEWGAAAHIWRGIDCEPLKLVFCCSLGWWGSLQPYLVSCEVSCDSWNSLDPGTCLWIALLHGLPLCTALGSRSHVLIRLCSSGQHAFGTSMEMGKQIQRYLVSLALLELELVSSF